MPDLSATITLRPTRFGLLTAPTAMLTVKAFMRANACLWGGQFNPIIPVFRIAPKEWRETRPAREKGQKVGEGPPVDHPANAQRVQARSSVILRRQLNRST